MISIINKNHPIRAAKTHEERVAAHQARTRTIQDDHEAADREIKRLIADRNAKRERELAEAGAAVEEARKRAGAAIVAAWTASTDPLFARWVADPTRRIAGEIGEVMRSIGTRSREELGDPLWEGHLTVGIAAAMLASRPEVAAFLAVGPTTSNLVNGAHAAWRAAEDTAALFDALERLELAALDASRRTPLELGTVARARFAVMRGNCTYGDVMEALRLFDEGVNRDRATEYRATGTVGAHPIFGNG